MHSGRAAELGSRGGRRRARFSPDNLRLVPAPKTAADVRDLLAQSMVELRAGELDPRIASSICSLVAEFLKTRRDCCWMSVQGVGKIGIERRRIRRIINKVRTCHDVGSL